MVTVSSKNSGFYATTDEKISNMAPFGCFRVDLHDHDVNNIFAIIFQIIMTFVKIVRDELSLQFTGASK